MQIDPKDHASRNIYYLLTSIVVPRPIAWVSTVSRDGIANLAPFSFFNAITSKPPLLSISVGRRRGQRKDTANNASSTGELVVNKMAEANLEAMVASSGDFAPEVDEFEKAGVTPIPSVLVTPPRVKEAPVQLECRTREIFEVSPGIVDLLIAEVLLVHIDEQLEVDDELRVSADALRPVGRLGGSDYAFLGKRRTVPRPKV
jgi:flavin reductase (DIM6/NTAB) family NADH-FMN oxidoreductase RutF